MRLRITGVAVVLVVAGCTSSAGTAPASSGRGSSEPASRGPRSTNTTTRTVAATASAPKSTAQSTATSAAGTAQSTRGTATAPILAAAPKLTHFRAVDLTWIGNQGWALGSARCLSGRGTCDAIEHTTDGGRKWSSMPAPRAHIASSPGQCNDPCVASIRFATSRIGYAFGDADPGSTLFMTLDGGRTWRAQRGNAVLLEAANGTAIRVRARQGGCPGPCVSAVQTGPVGGTAWTSRLSASRDLPEAGVEFARHGAQAYLLFEGNPAGGGDYATSVQYRTTDGGLRWVRDGEPCPQVGRGIGRDVDSSLPSVGPDGTYVLRCQWRDGNRSYLLRSTDRGRSYHRGPSVRFGTDEVAIVVGPVSAHVTVVSTSRATYRSTGGGFTRLAGLGTMRWIGFSSSSVGHAISADGSRVWRTSDGGRTWLAYRFS